MPVLQLLKRLFGLKDTGMVWFAFLVSLVLGAFVCLVLGQVSLTELLTEPLVLFGSGSVVFSVATVVYRTLKERLGLEEKKK